MVGHYNAHGNTANPNRSCHCPHEDMYNPRPDCQFVTMEEINLAYENNNVAAFRAMPMRPINSCFFGVPISCQYHGICGIVPSCVLHTMGGGIMKYQFLCVNELIGPGKSKQREKATFDMCHQNMAIACSCQSDNTMPRWSTR